MYEFKVIALLLWAVGTALVMLMTAMGRIRADHFNNVPWSQCLKSPQHQIFIVTILAWLMIFIMRLSEDCNG